MTSSCGVRGGGNSEVYLPPVWRVIALLRLRLSRPRKIANRRAANPEENEELRVIQKSTVELFNRTDCCAHSFESAGRGTWMAGRLRIRHAQGNIDTNQITKRVSWIGDRKGECLEKSAAPRPTKDG